MNSAKLHNTNRQRLINDCVEYLHHTLDVVHKIGGAQPYLRHSLLNGFFEVSDFLRQQWTPEIDMLVKTKFSDYAYITSLQALEEFIEERFYPDLPNMTDEEWLSRECRQ